MGDAPLLSHCSLLRNSLPKPTGVLEHCREWETSFSGHFLLTESLGRRRMSLYISLFTVAIAVSYASEFRELFEATIYICQSQHTCLVLYYIYIYIYIACFIYRASQHV